MHTHNVIALCKSMMHRDEYFTLRTQKKDGDLPTISSRDITRQRGIKIAVFQNELGNVNETVCDVGDNRKSCRKP